MAEANYKINESSDEELKKAADINDSKLALQGITLLLNNQWQEAEELFNSHRDESPLMYAGSSFILFMQAMMSFEDEKLAEAMKVMQETEKVCGEESKKFKGKSAKGEDASALALEDRLQRRIIVGDCIMYEAVLTFINQDLSSYIKGGWLLRKSWKIYEKLYGDVRALCSPDGVRQFTFLDEKTTEREGSHSSSEEAGGGRGADQRLPRAVAERLMGAVCFGYGSFQLCISMLPPKILKIIQFLGFDGDRQVGLDALEYCSRSDDMKAPFGTLALLWYHTVIRPFFALDGVSVAAGVEDASLILERGERDHPECALYIFFKARIHRLTAQVDEALAIYTKALDRCANQREIQLMCYYEIGWVNMMKLCFAEAGACFLKLKEGSKWSKSFYSYLSAVCLGAVGNLTGPGGAIELMREVPALVRRKNNQVEAFVARKANGFKATDPTREGLTLLVFEVLYLWNAIPQCTKKDTRRMLEECGKVKDASLSHLRNLIEAVLYQQLGESALSLQCFEEAISRHHGMKNDQHVAAFATYEMASTLLQEPETYEQGKKFLQKAKDNYHDYDFENRLSVRIHAALRRVKQQGTPV